jgi:hypothetical protein
MFRLLPFLSMVAAAFTKCATNVLPIYDLYADPMDLVANNQPVYLQAIFAVPPNSFVLNGRAEARPIWNGVRLPAYQKPISALGSGVNTLNQSFVFPAGVGGPVVVEINVYNATGSSILCLKWSVYATGTHSNKTRFTTAW